MKHQRLIIALSVLVTLTTLSGCNTVAGMAADVEAAARGTQDYLADGLEPRPQRKP